MDLDFCYDLHFYVKAVEKAHTQEGLELYSDSTFADRSEVPKMHVRLSNPVPKFHDPLKRVIEAKEHVSLGCPP